MLHRKHNKPVLFAICLAEDPQGGDLTLHKLYRVIPDADAERHAYLRVIDDSGEDYLYSAKFFVVLTLPAEVEEAVLAQAAP